MKKEDYDCAMSALDYIKGSLGKYAIRKPGDPTKSGASGRLEGDQDDKSLKTEESETFLTLDGASGEPEMPEADSPADQSDDAAPEANVMRMLSYKTRDVAPRGTRPESPLHLASIPESSKRPRGRPRKVL